MAKAAPIAELTEEQVSTLQSWMVAKDELADVKGFEMQYRLDVVKTLPFKADKEEGSQTLTLNAGWKLALTKTMDYKMETKDSEKVIAIMGQLHAVAPEKAAHLITRWEPVMSVEVYKSLTDEEKLIVAEIVTIKPGSPQLKMTPPAEPKK